MKVVIVHDWLIHMRGGEKVLHEIAELYPEAVIYTLFCDRENISPRLQSMTIKTSWLQHLPGITRYYRWLLPILPWVIRSFHLPQDVDVVISNSHCVAKGVKVPSKAVHICYCNTPMRYIWGFEEDYFGKFHPLVKSLIEFIFKFMRKWDLAVNQDVDFFISNSENVRKRIQNIYGRDAAVIYPPADIRFFKPSENHEDFYLVVSAFVPYKRVDLVISAFKDFGGRKLKIVGSGPLETKYRALATGSQISFLGKVSDPELQVIYGNAKALIFPTNEDFGIVPIEAQACGTPVIALVVGGALETVQQGVFFKEQTVGDLRRAVLEFESLSWDWKKISQSVARFDKIYFQNHFKEFVNQCLKK